MILNLILGGAVFLLIGTLVLVFRTAGLYRKTIASECKSLAEYISALAYGNLTQTFPASIHQPRFTYLNVIYHEIEEIKRSYNNLTATPLERICYVGTDPYIEGIKCARAMADFCNKRGKIIVIITVSLDISNLDLRYRGFKNVFIEESPGMEIIDVFEARGNTEQAHDYVVSALREHPDLAGIYISGGSMAAPAALALEETGKAGRVALVCHDLGMEMADYVRKGVITATILQDPLIQGHDPIIHMYNHLVGGWRPIQPRLLCVMDSVTKDNCGEFWDYGEATLKITKQITERMAKPLAVSERKIKIAVLGQDWNNFFLQIKSGSLQAMEELRSRNAEVDWLVFNQARRGQDEILAEIEAITERLIAEQYDGIVMIVGLKSIVPCLNKAVAAGLPVITFNSEPLGLLGMLLWLERTSKHLQNMSNELTEGSSQIRLAMEQITHTSFDMVNRLVSQGESTMKGQASTERLMTMLENTTEGEKSQLAVVEQSSQLTKHISDLMARFHGQMKGMQEVKNEISFSSKKIKEMEGSSTQIGSIVSKIDHIASQTNILAINASIQAARVSESGKGFKVIADEVMNLAGESGKAVIEITALVKNIQDAISASVKATERSSAEVEKQLALIMEGVNELEKLSGSLVDIMDQIQKTSQNNADVIMEMRNNSRQLSDVMNATSHISADNNAAIEMLSASTVQISAQMNEITKTVTILKSIVLVLQGSLAQFNLLKSE